MEHNNNFTTPEKSIFKTVLPKALLISLLIAVQKNGTNITQIIKDSIKGRLQEYNPNPHFEKNFKPKFKLSLNEDGRPNITVPDEVFEIIKLVGVENSKEGETRKPTSIIADGINIAKDRRGENFKKWKQEQKEK